MYQRVLVPLDGSPVAESILPFIEQIAVFLMRISEAAPESAA